MAEKPTVSVTVSYGTDVRSVSVAEGSSLAVAIHSSGLPLEQPCGGRGSCGKCRVLTEGTLSPPDEVELKKLSPAERSAGYRLACRAQALGDSMVNLAPIVVYSNKVFQAGDAYEQEGIPLGLAIDLGSTTVAAFLTTLTNGQVCAGAAALNQQTVFGADVISRLGAAAQGKDAAQRLSALAQASIVQAIDALQLSQRARQRVRKMTIVGNCAMHHLLLGYPTESLSVLPFQPYSTATVRQPAGLLSGVLPSAVEIAVPPLIGGFVGSDALACMAYYDFDRAPGPMAAIDLGTNGEVMITDTERILVASTAAGPAFEGVNISCGTRAIDGAVVAVAAREEDGSFDLVTIGGHPPIGLTGSGLLDLVYELRRVGVIEPSGRMVADHPVFGHRMSTGEDGVRRLLITDRGGKGAGESEAPLYLTQQDVRELQKAKAAIRAAAEVLLARLGLDAGDLQRMVLTGSFGSQLHVRAVVGVGMIPDVPPDIVEPSANGAGFGAALFLDDEEFARGERIAAEAKQVDLDTDARFNELYIRSIHMPALDTVWQKSPPAL